ncbi:MAG TPA: FAD-binding and (Fe-S)-binding domain-containing protein [Myxococcales bacterium]|nr:FAD-binding and (Fe-S)-binding domain-containing protein [Myxococcales bacterium]
MPGLQTLVRLHARPAQRARDLDVEALERALRVRLEGEVRFDAGSRALYATDGSNYRQVPIGVVVPKTVQDLVEAVACAREHGAPIVARGGGTSLAGQCCNVALVIDCSKYLNRILWLDPARRLARVQPGLVLDRLRERAEEHHLTFAPDPSTHNHCTLGGMIGNNSCGVHSVMGGMTQDNVVELEVLLYDGTRLTLGPATPPELETLCSERSRRGDIHRRLRALRDRHEAQIRTRFPRIPRRVSGYDLPQLLPENGFNLARALVGTEGTCALVLSAVVRLVPSPPCRSLLVLGYEDVYASADHIPEVIESGCIGCEGIDDKLVDFMKEKGIHPQDTQLLPEGAGWLLVEFGGETREESDARAKALMERLRRTAHPPSMKLFDDREEEKKLWKVRESGLGATARKLDGKENWEGWEDSSVPVARLGAYLRDLRGLFDRFGYDGALYGHFGQGCVHTRIDFDLRTAAGIARYRAFIAEAARLVVSHGGSLSGEHGDGQSKAEFLPLMYGDELVGAFEEFKAIWDPDWKLNPGKVVRPHRIDQNLRIGTDYRPPEPRTEFSYAGDNGSFAKATARCVGIGECRKTDAGTMCPSYMVTLEEKHSTRGRAHLLFEMLEGNPLRDAWRSGEVKEALDLCLACKGCKGECPVNVDMATYKAEFLSHHYRRRLRPRAAYAMGLIHWWSRIASRMPSAANFVAHAPVLSRLFKLAGGVAPARRIPRFAPQTFRAWFAARPRVNAGRERVLLWADTFNDFFQPQVLRAATEVLEEAGLEVTVQAEKLCCGRPLYDYGMLRLAKHKLRQILVELRGEIGRGTPVIGLEPSCVSVLRDELRELFPNDADAQRLWKQTRTLAAFLQERKWKPPPLSRKALVHGHCHHKAVLGWEKEAKFIEAALPGHEVVDSGCCGMAGSFGYEADKYDVSMQIGERRLLPRVRAATPGTLIVADGFSCRSQIETEGREPVHLAQALQMAIRQRRPEPRESRLATRRLRRRRLLRHGLFAAATIAMVAFRIRGHHT